MRSLPAVALGLLALLTACGAVAGTPGASPTPSRPSQLTVADNGRTITMSQGQTLEVALEEQPGFSAWSHPTSSDTSVVAPQVDPRAAAVQGMTLATFRAARRGRADLQSGAGSRCSPGVACPALARGWQVHVVVE